MASLSAIRTGLKDRLTTIPGLKAYAEAPGTVMVPCAMVLPGPIDFDQSMARGADLFVFEVRLLVGRPVDKLAQEHLDIYLAGSGESSVKAAIEGDGTLGGVADWARVVAVLSYGDIEHSGLPYLGARFRVEVDADGS